MTINGHGLRDHLRLLASPLALITAVWALRWVLDAAGVPDEIVRIFSVSVATPVAVLLAVLLIHGRRFGSYANVAASAFLLTAWAELLICAAIAFSALTGLMNVYNAPRSSDGQTPLQHIGGHLTFGLVITTLFGTAIGSFLLWLLRRWSGMEAHR